MSLRRALVVELLLLGAIELTATTGLAPEAVAAALANWPSLVIAAAASATVAIAGRRRRESFFAALALFGFFALAPAYDALALALHPRIDGTAFGGLASWLALPSLLLTLAAPIPVALVAARRGRADVVAAFLVAGAGAYAVELMFPLLVALRAAAAVVAIVYARAPKPKASANADADADADASVGRAVTAAFFLSGFAGLIYEVVFAKALALTFGSTARAATTVLATYMGGIALGAFAGGRLGSRRADPLRVYAACEAAVAVFAALTPLSFRLVRAAYVALAGGGDASRPSLTWLQLGLGALVLLPPTLAMGVTMPILARWFRQRGQALGASVGTLYAANTLGAALGSIVSGYAILPVLGIRGTTALAVAANLAVAVVALRLHAREKVATAADDEVAATPTRHDRARPLVILFAGGAVTLALEIVYTHLGAVVAGNSAYAFALMLGCFLVALGGGAAFMRRRLARGADFALALAWCQCGVALAVACGSFLWNAVPDYFAAFDGHAATRSFGAREIIRGLVCVVAMAPPAAFIGAAYPAAMEWIGRTSARPVAAFGRASAVNTAGNIVGALAGAALLGSLGALHATWLCAAVSAALAVVAALGATRRLLAAAPLVLVAVAFVAQPRSFDLSRLASGANVYFAYQAYGDVIDHAESLDGGLTTVAQSFDRGGRRVLTLLTNGKFQGDDSVDREVAAQWGFALYPLLHTAARDRALVIGFGTGVTSAAVHDAGFAHVDVVDLSRDILSLADRWFAAVNEGVLHARGVSGHVSDGRNWLMLTRDKYDLVTIEITSIWFAGAASLYNRELYQLASDALGDDGVLQQWMQLHRVSPADLASVLASVRAVFPRAWLYIGGNQGAIVACKRACDPTAATLALLDGNPALAHALAPFGGHAQDLVRQRLLDPDAIDRLLQATAAEAGVTVDELVSTDDNSFLEYDTPRGNVRPFAESLRANERWLARFR